MQPARSLLCVLVPARRLDACAAILSERLRQTIADLGVARAGKLIERNWTQEPRGELVGSAPLYQKHATACIRHRHRKNQSTVRAQTVEPGRQRMGRPGARHNDVEHSKTFGRPVAVRHFDLRPWGKRVARAFGKRLVDLYRRDFARGSDKLRQDCSVVTHAAAQMDHALAADDVQRVEHEGPKARLAVLRRRFSS
jgi:hypothetical protein